MPTTPKKIRKKVSTKPATTHPRHKVTPANKKAAPAVPSREAEAKPRVRPKVRYIFALGRRKTAEAKIKLYLEGRGELTVNNRPFLSYFPTAPLQKIASDPLEQTGLLKSVDIVAEARGGGIAAQAQAVALAISRGLAAAQPELRLTLKKLGFLTRDARKKERKKPGLKRARRAPQWQKR